MVLAMADIMIVIAMFWDVNGDEADSVVLYFFFSSRRRHTRCSRDWSSDVCSSDLLVRLQEADPEEASPGAPARHAAWLDWLNRSPKHLNVFLETLETERRLHKRDRKSVV